MGYRKILAFDNNRKKDLKKKGLRHDALIFIFTLLSIQEKRPQKEGIATLGGVILRVDNYRKKDLKKKGLRRSAATSLSTHSNRKKDLKKKGLRRHMAGTPISSPPLQEKRPQKEGIATKLLFRLSLEAGQEKRPQKEGIATIVLIVNTLKRWYRKKDLKKKGLRLESLLQFAFSFIGKKTSKRRDCDTCQTKTRYDPPYRKKDLKKKGLRPSGI